MVRNSAVALLCLMIVSAACGAGDTPGDDAARGSLEQASIAPQSFTVRVGAGTTVNNVIQRIVRAGHDQLAGMCEAAPGGAVRIYNPLADGAYADLTCSALLDGDEASGEASAGLGAGEGGERVEEAAQRLTPLALACFAASAAAGLAGTLSCERHPRDRGCGRGVWGGTTAFSLICLVF